MIICPKCRHDNPLGRVFCGKCGTKLDFAHTSSQDMAAKIEPSPIARHWRKVVYPIILLIVVLVAMVLWPAADLIGKPPGTTGGDKRVENGVKALAAMKRGQVVNAAFAEEDLNAYFQQTKAAAWKVESFSVASMQGFFKVHMVRPLLDSGKKINGVPLAIRISYDIVCVPVTGGIITVPQATIGHLRLPGAFKSKAVNAILTTVRNDKDWVPFNSISDMKAENGRLLVTIKP